YDGNDFMSGFAEASFDIAVTARYAINRNFALDVGYTHTEVISDSSFFREYSRNRIYAGATFTF
ncbi:MAG: outer membrane beta-barrel protein, partial [Verrucomicrobiota bacterium]|nr:outer membrane beta-barrel protein [Verrucomicrobiota bacterium]